MFLRSMNPNYSKLHICKNPYIYQKFTLDSLGILCNPLTYNKFLLSYNNLPIDKNHINHNDNYPTRLRRFAKYNISIRTDNHYNIFYNHSLHFTQNVPDSRHVTRKFEPMESQFIKEHWILELITQSLSSSIKYSHKKGIQQAEVSLHQVRQICYPNMESHNSPEGIHQDGADFIVSAFVLNRQNISEGKTIIFNKYKDEIYNTTLHNGEGIFQEDKELWHYVTPIQANDNFIGYRDILGIDIILK